MLLIVKLDQRDPKQRAVFQIKLSARDLFANVLRSGLALIARQATDVDHLQVKIRRFVDPLQRLTVALVKACSQRFVALDQLRKTAAQGGFIQFAT